MAGTNKKRTASAGARGTGRRKPDSLKKQTRSKKDDQKEEGFFGAEILIICSFAVSILLFLSNFGLCGMAGDFLRGVQLGLFGIIGYLLPAAIFVGTCFYMSNRGNSKAMMKMTAVICLLLSLCGLSQLLFGETLKPEQKLTMFYKISSVAGKGGGLVGGIFASALRSVIGIVGAFLVMLVSVVICVVCITEKSVVNVVKKGSGKAYQYAKEDMGRRRELYAERQEEKRRLREEQKVRGVDLDSTTLTAPEDFDDFDDLDGYEDFESFNEGRAPVKGTVAAADGDLLDQVLDSFADESKSAPGEAAASAAFARPADVFTGHIVFPPEPAVVTEEDLVPFDDGIVMNIQKKTENSDIFIHRDTRTLEEMDVEEEIIPAESQEDDRSFFVPEQEKRVVTVSGKIIETDTELLNKKLETKREEAAEAGDLSVSQQIKEKETVVKKEYIFPPYSLLKRGVRPANTFSEQEYTDTAIKLQQTLQNFGVGVTVTNISCGPSVTRYELLPEQGVKVSRIVGLTDDIKLSLAAADIRIEAPIPGKSAVGIEVPNKENTMVLLRDLLEADEFKRHPSRLAFGVGKDIAGQTVVTDIAKMPHLLIAGATGSGKSVCINTLIMSVLFKASPEDVKLIMVDPKVVELSVYNGIPHLLIPVVTDPKKASGALNWAVAEMTDRYKKFADYNVRDLKGYNEKVKEIEEIEDDNKPQKLPQIIIIVDELADLMMVAPGEVEEAICRLAQLARAAGIHLVIATQRPSVNVITGLIKANVPSRIAFSVSSGVDSRTIIDMNGAEKLLGKGDMLFYPAGVQKPQRVQGAFVSDQEVSKVVEFLTSQQMVTDYQPDIESKMAVPAQDAAESQSDKDSYFVQAGKFIIEKDKASIGMLQRVFKIGFNRAARIMDQLAEAGIVGEEEGTKPRKILMTMEEFDEMTKHEV